MKNKRLINEIANERINLLLNMAERELKEDNAQLSKRYIKIASDIRHHYKIRNKEFSKRLCRKCHAMLLPGLTCKVIMASSKRKIIYKCNSCGHENKIHY